jgi:CheY-like chemotaxis protein
MNTNIQLESIEGKGSRFFFDLHLIETSKTFLDQHSDNTSENNTDIENARILLVEDVDFNRVIAERFFKMWNLKFDSAANGTDAIKLASKRSYDLVLMDIQLPDMDGFTAIQKIRETARNSETFVLALTASGLSEIKSNMELYNVQGYISKPFISSDLRQIVSSWIVKARKVNA